jgi:hypothetical protein
LGSALSEKFADADEPFARRSSMAMPGLKIEDAVNANCPWSGKPISADSLTRYRGQVVGFCNPGCRDKFEQP